LEEGVAEGLGWEDEEAEVEAPGCCTGVEKVDFIMPPVPTIVPFHTI